MNTTQQLNKAVEFLAEANRNIGYAIEEVAIVAQVDKTVSFMDLRELAQQGVKLERDLLRAFIRHNAQEARPK